MRIGSLVELVDDNWNKTPMEFEANIQLKRLGVVYPERDKIYTVREIDTDEYGTGITVEEIVNPSVQFINKVAEPAWRIERFRELLPPMSIDIEQFMTQEV